MGGYQQDVITICMQFPICINANESRRKKKAKRNERAREQDRKRKKEEEGVSGGMWRRRC